MQSSIENKKREAFRMQRVPIRSKSNAAQQRQSGIYQQGCLEHVVFHQDSILCKERARSIVVKFRNVKTPKQGPKTKDVHFNRTISCIGT
jgi:hypothetical protein